MDKFNNSNSSLALQKFYNQQNHDIRLLELQQRLKTEQLMCHIEMTNEEEKVVVEEKVVEEKVVEEKVVEEIPDTQIVQFDTVYQSNENFEIEKPTSSSVENSKPVLNQVKINNLIKLKKW
jgi:uncharacterized protein (UPF0371 family)